MNEDDDKIKEYFQISKEEFFEIGNKTYKILNFIKKFL